MFKSNVKNVVVASAIAVLAGVTMLGVNSAFGVDGPLQNPDNAKLVSPTFNGINSQSLNVSTGIYNGSTGAVKITDTDGMTVSGKLDVQADAILGKTDNSSLLNLRGSTISVYGATSFYNNIDMIGSYPTISNLAEINNKGNDLWLNIGASVLKLKKDGNIEVQGSIGGSGGNPLTLKSATVSTALNLTNNGNNNVSGSNVWGQIKVGPDGGQQLLIDRNSIDAYSGNLAINSFGGNDVVVGTSAANSDLTVNGAVKGKSFGTYTRYTSSFAAIAANDIYETSMACPTATQLISCGAQGSDSTSYTPTKSVTFSNIDPYLPSNTCYARGINTSGSTKYVRAIAICLNPAI